MPPRASNRLKNGRLKLFPGSSGPSKSLDASVSSSQLSKSGKKPPSIAQSDKPLETLAKILKEAGLTYDESTGTLSGLPVFLSGLNSLSLQTLHNMKALVKLLRRQFKEISSQDSITVLRAKLALETRFGKQILSSSDLTEMAALNMKPSDFGISDERVEEIKAPVTQNQPCELTAEAPEVSLGKSIGKRPLEDEQDKPEVKKPKIEDQDHEMVPLESPVPENAASQAFKIPPVLTDATKELGLFVPDPEKARQKDLEYLKKWYGVASFPTDYLEKYLTGPVPDIDFDAQGDKKGKDGKQPQKINFNNFMSYVDHYFRPLDDADLVFLRKKDVYLPLLDSIYAEQTGGTGGVLEAGYNPRVHPYIIPALGKPSTATWADDESGKAGNSIENLKRKVVPRGGEGLVLDNVLESDEVSCGPLTLRLLQALIPNEGEPVEIDEDEYSSQNEIEEDEAPQPEGPPPADLVFYENPDSEAFEYDALEHRLERELRYVGVFLNYTHENETNEDMGGEGFEDIWVTHKEDDEICRELRALQNELRAVRIRNNMRKKVLFKKAYEEMSFREFYGILESLNKQIDQYYLKKMKLKNKKKDEAAVSHQQVLDKTLSSLMEKRKKWILEIGPLFGYTSNLQLRDLPEKGIFGDAVEKVGVDNWAEFGNEEDEEEDNVVNEAEGVTVKNEELKLD